MPDHISLEESDQQTIERLRQKYARPTDGMPLDPNSADASGADPTPVNALCTTGACGAGEWSARDSAPGVQSSVCSTCRGSGSVIEEYNHRRLEKFCTVCEGKGVRLYRDGVELKGSAAVSKSSSTAKQATLSRDERLKKLQSEIFRINNRIQWYQQELSSMPQQEDAEAQRLQEKLAAQIKAQVERLECERASREAALAELQG